MQIARAQTGPCNLSLISIRRTNGLALDPAHGMVEEGDEITGDAGDDGVYQTRHHERVVQEIFADYGRA